MPQFTTPARSTEEVLAHIEAQMCPWCDKGPFQVLARHTHNAHGVDRFALREAAGLPKTAKGICAPEISTATASRGAERIAALTPTQREDLFSRRDAGMREKYTPDERRKQALKHWESLSDEERAKSLDRLNSMDLGDRGKRISRALLAADPEQRSNRARAAMMSLSPEQRSEMSRRAHSVHTPEEWADIARRNWASKSPEERERIARSIAETRLGGARISAPEGARIRSLREARGLTQQQLGDLIGKSPAATSRLEAGKGGLSVTQAAVLRERLGFHA